ncbi:hypothetical protein NQ318_019566 [Aromia moschata]|uniref:Uncharacterized protein n=1 Tax=Aromia moschata TaxID=1265417 RepID=A0AAV8Z3R8_9CUCU|nr:hypothetical protein NQ318_019566 [Aromia moschata]
MIRVLLEPYCTVVVCKIRLSLNFYNSDTIPMYVQSETKVMIPQLFEGCLSSENATLKKVGVGPLWWDTMYNGLSTTMSRITRIESDTNRRDRYCLVTFSIVYRVCEALDPTWTRPR